MEILGLISEHKLSLILGIIYVIVYESVAPIPGLFFGKVLVAISRQKKRIIRSDGLKLSLFHLRLAVVGGINGN